ncbi:3-methyladenine DNA glycosylase AlkC [Kitasatospora sp. MAP12-15]|uniref:DNA alkylation repair protein n=1 Tax=unclassified Kitasatospora TaxID=2633591 RepID=UPI002476086A|nr:DNA alkylation repair protein [Kitasatospora sp. MAP12-44]MDH6111424.1 3-methyladenine DNA glycosylase AlkC [Kitasatospora sp. MAP12-44]
MTAQVPLKERALNDERIARIGREVQAVLPAFDADAFTADVMSDLPRLELKARIARTARGLHEHLPVTGPAALDALVHSLPSSPQAAGVTNDFGFHIYSPHSSYVARYHRTTEDLDQALEALRAFTRYFSSEDAARYFLNDFPEQTMAAVEKWTVDDDYRVRRLASESTRPMLPGSPRITLPVGTALPILDRLYGDTSHFVTTSVANHLRDISRSEPDLALATLTRWKTEGAATDKEFAFIAREALKAKLKEGWPAGYGFLGYAADAPVAVSSVRLEHTELRDGDALSFTADLTATTTVEVNVMYVISSTTSTGKPRQKVYALKKGTATPDQPMTLAKTHRLRSTATTALTPGAYQLAIQVNGHRFDHAEFRVVER